MYTQEYTQKLTLETNLFYLDVSDYDTANIVAFDTTPLDEYIYVIERVLSIYPHDMVVNFDLLFKNGIVKRYYSCIFSQETKSITPLNKEIPSERDIETMNTFLLNNIHLLEYRFPVGNNDIYHSIIKTSCSHIDELKELDSDVMKYLSESKYKIKMDHTKDFIVNPTE